MQLVCLLDLVDDIDELSSTHEADKHHHEEENVDVFAEKDCGVEHVEGEEDELCDSDHPNLLDLDKGEGWARDEYAELVAQVEDYEGVLVDKLVFAARDKIDDLLSVCDGKWRSNGVLEEVDERQIGHQKSNFAKDSAHVLTREADVVLDAFLL